MSILLQAIGLNIRTFRKELGISQEELASRAELHRTYVGAVERGERNISALNIEKLAEVLCVKPSRLLEFEDKNVTP